MSILTEILLSTLVTFALTMLIAPLVIKLMKRAHASQSILEYVDNHSDKRGTPTMGGVMFLLPITIVSLVFGGVSSKSMLVTLATMLAFGVLGFLDDFIKVRCRHNEGLKPYQKIIGQLGIGIVVTLFAYYDPSIGTAIRLPFSDRYVDMSYFYIAFTLIVFLSTTNAVNLTDGLDGLATSTTLIYVATFVIVLLLGMDDIRGDVVAMANSRSEIIFLASTFGGLLAFLWHNTNKARIFMGDTGSLALGGMVGAVAVFSRNTLLIPIIGIMYMMSCISVIIQVLYFKLSHGGRVFLMAPLHHHLQYKGMTENKIVTIYSIITCLAGMVAVVSIV